LYSVEAVPSKVKNSQKCIANANVQVVDAFFNTFYMLPNLRLDNQAAFTVSKILIKK
jgi:hypothetical protein